MAPPAPAPVDERHSSFLMASWRSWSSLTTRRAITAARSNPLADRAGCAQPFPRCLQRQSPSVRSLYSMQGDRPVQAASDLARKNVLAPPSSGDMQTVSLVE